MIGFGLLEILVLAVVGLVVTVVVAVVVIVLVNRGHGSGAGPMERIHRDYRQLTPAQKQALLDFVQADLGGRP
jgi:Na+/citrate or Na+/malate symporter